MKAISLLPPEIKQKRLLDQKINRAFTITTVALVIMLAVYAVLFVAGIKLRSDLRALERARAAVEAEAAALEEYAGLFDKLTDAENIIRQAGGTVPQWSDLLQDIGYSLPHGAWLAEVTAEYAENGGEIQLTGWAYDHSDVAALLEQVYKLGKLEDVRCQVSSATSIDGQDVVKFFIQARLTTGPPFLDSLEGGG
ncbi:MAG: PilN domain-containing protein [Bacillota bacterium]